MSSTSKKANGRASGPVLSAGFLVVLDHSGVKVDLGEGKDGSSGRMVAREGWWREDDGKGRMVLRKDGSRGRMVTREGW